MLLDALSIDENSEDADSINAFIPVIYSIYEEYTTLQSSSPQTYTVFCCRPCTVYTCQQTGTWITVCPQKVFCICTKWLFTVRHSRKHIHLRLQLVQTSQRDMNERKSKRSDAESKKHLTGSLKLDICLNEISTHWDVMTMWSCANVFVCVLQASGARVRQRGGLTWFLSWFENNTPKTASSDHRSLHKALCMNQNKQSVSPIYQSQIWLQCKKTAENSKNREKILFNTF